jgi:hypothetical protein
MMKIRTATALTLVAGFTLACSGMMPGTTLNSAPVTPGQPFSLAWTDAGGVNNVWLSYDLAHGGFYQVTGPIELLVDGQVADSWNLDFGPEGGPIQGNSTRISNGTQDLNFGGSGSSSGMIRLLVLDEGAMERKLELKGTFTATTGTTINNLEVLVTD